MSLTYTQIKDSTRQTGTLRSAKETVKLPFAHLVQLNPEVDKGNERFKVQINLDKPSPGLTELFPSLTAPLGS